MPTIPRILATTALCLAAVGLSSCTIVDTGSAVNNVGRYIPVDAKRLPLQIHPHKDKCYTVYTTGELSYIELSICYRSAKAKWFHCFQVGGCPVELYERHYNSLSPRPEYYYAEVPTKHLTHNPLRHVTCLIPQQNFDVPYAQCSTITLEHSAQSLISRLFPVRCSTANTAVQPIRWVAEVSDIPLSIIATPANWLLMLFDVNLWRL